jgi:hypothetical protein
MINEKKTDFQIGDILKWNLNHEDYGARVGALAVVVDVRGCFLEVEWLAETKHLSNRQADGTYYEERFVRGN